MFILVKEINDTSTSELEERLIDKISGTEDEVLLLEVCRLLELDGEDAGNYALTDEQISVVNESQQEIKRGKFFSDHDANKEIDEWLGKSSDFSAPSRTGRRFLHIGITGTAPIHTVKNSIGFSKKPLHF